MMNKVVWVVFVLIFCLDWIECIWVFYYLLKEEFYIVVIIVCEFKFLNIFLYECYIRKLFYCFISCLIWCLNELNLFLILKCEILNFNFNLIEKRWKFNIEFVLKFKVLCLWCIVVKE